MRKPLRHLVLPAAVPALFFAIAATPVAAIGCRNRGLLAVGVAFLGLAGAAAAIRRVHAERRAGGPDIFWWSATALVLMVPAFGLLLLA